MKFVPVESTDTRLYVFEEEHLTGGKATVLIEGRQIVNFMREMTARPMDSTHQDWINEFCQMYNAVQIKVPPVLQEK